MRGAEKPFENLLSKEKEGFELCSEIIEWTTPESKYSKLLPNLITYPGVIELRERATKLFEQISNMDMAHDDKYFLVHGAIAVLRKDYNRLRAAIFKSNRPDHHEFFQTYYFDRESPIALIEHIKQLLAEGYHELSFSFRDPRGGGWGDGADIRIEDWKRLHAGRYKNATHAPKNGFGVHFSELFDYTVFQEPYIEAVQEALTKILFQKPNIKRHMHDYGGMQYDIHLLAPTINETLQIVQAIVRGVQTKPRTEK